MLNRLYREFPFIPNKQMDFYSDIYQLIFYYINSDSYLYVLLTCKEWLFYGYKYLDFTINDNIMIKASSKLGNIQTVNRLLQDPRVGKVIPRDKPGGKASDPSAEDQAAIGWASVNGHLQVVEALLKDSRGRAEPCGPKAVDPSADNQYAIQFSSMFGHTKIVERLLQDSRADPSADNQYAIGQAAKGGHLQIVEALLKDPRVAKLYPGGV